MVCVVTVNAQQVVLDYFDTNGTIRLETEELNASADTLVTVFHRKDDVVWARLTYRIIDLRYKQNYQLYYPEKHDDPKYKSLFRIILQAVQERMPIYEAKERKDQPFTPEFSESTRIKLKELALQGGKTIFVANDAEGQQGELDDEESYILYYDSVTNQMIFNPSRYQNYVKNQIKYMIQEVIFFDKHTSRLHRQIIAIAPLQPDRATSTDPMLFLRQSIKFWVLYKDLRPYLASNYISNNGNEQKRVTFDDFFQKRLYTSYLVGENNIYNRMILDYAKEEQSAKKEQARIETELLNFEQDLWEY
jgi:gliding motility associated protien GldN